MSVGIASGCLHINSGHCDHDMNLFHIGAVPYHPLTKFGYRNILNYVSMTMVALAIYQVWIWVKVSVGKALMSGRIRHIFKLAEFTLNIFTKSRVFGTMM